MKDKDEEVRIVEHEGRGEPPGEAQWCDGTRSIIVPGIPELWLFPHMLTWHQGNSRVERPYVKTVTYFPDLRTLRRKQGGDAFRLTYRSVRDAKCWIVFTSASDRSLWKAEKFLRGRRVGMTIGRPDVNFLIHLALLPITDEENHFSRDWPADEIAAMFGRPGPNPGPIDGENDGGLSKLCREVLDMVQRAERLGRADAAALLCKTIGKVAARGDEKSG